MFKEVFIEHMEGLIPPQGANILELGSGTSAPVADLLRRRPDIRYTGVEPSQRAYEAAQQAIGHLPNVRLINDFAYDIQDLGTFDLCFSLSVLEHVKQLETFLEQSVLAVKNGGYIVHRYDLGHALTPTSLKERVQVFLGNHAPRLLSEHKFVCYLSPERVVDILTKKGAVTERITYHQMPEHKELFKKLGHSPAVTDAARRIAEWEFDVSPLLDEVPARVRESLFPAVAVWARKEADTRSA